MKAVLDACVLYPTLLREVTLGVGARGLLDPVWSARILEEWRLAVLKHHPEQAEEAAAEIAAVRAAFPAAEIPVSDETEARLSLPDRNDRHVLAAAIDGRAGTVLTLNLRDFPGRTLARDNILPRSPDSVLTELFADAPGPVSDAVTEALARLRRVTGNTSADRALLKRAGLPRLGKAFAQG